MNRRGFIGSLLAAGTVAIAAEFKVSEAVAEEMVEELTKDASRTMIAMPGQAFIAPDDKIFQSTAEIRKFYAEECGKALARNIDNQIISVCRRMEGAIKDDLREIGSDARIVVEMPKIVINPQDVMNGKPRPRFELIAGVKPETDFLGNEYLKVGFLPGVGLSTDNQALVDHTGREFA